jgi:TonB family protein
MEFQSLQDAIDLLEQVPPPSPPLDANSGEHLHGEVEPKLDVAWGSFHAGSLRNFAALFGPSGLKNAPEASAFRDSWVERRVPARAVVAAALWHVAILALPFSLLSGMPHTNPALRNVEVTWQGPIDDLPLLEIAREKPKAAPKPKMDVPPPQLDADAFHPRQRIFTDPVRPTHPRQTLINPKAPAIAPKLMPVLPNMVLFQQAAGPAKPRLQINEEMLQKLRPKEKRAATVTAAPPADFPNLEQHVADMSLPAAQSGPARPKLELNAGAAPRLAQKAQTGDAEPAPEVDATQLTAANGGPSALIALSAHPAPPAPVAPPAGNTAARVSISPEGKAAAASNVNAANAGTGAGNSAVGISISGGSPAAKVSGSGGRIVAPSQKLTTRPDPKESEDAERTGPPDFATLPPGAKPEMIFASKKVYTLFVNMPNLNSSTGSWILNFSELRNNASRYATGDLSGPLPLKKVDPKYPPTAIVERVQGEVVLYAVIRRDGSVGNIQLVRGIDRQLDANAISALGQWKFRPASKQGAAVELEAIVHIPFRLPENN